MVLQLTLQVAPFSDDQPLTQWLAKCASIFGTSGPTMYQALLVINIVLYWSNHSDVKPTLTSKALWYQTILVTNINHLKVNPSVIYQLEVMIFVVVPGDTGTLLSSLCIVAMGSLKPGDVFHGNPWWPKSMVITNQLRHETHWLRSAIHIICPLDCTLASAAPANKGCAFDSSGSQMQPPWSIYPFLAPSHTGSYSCTVGFFAARFVGG